MCVRTHNGSSSSSNLADVHLIDFSQQWRCNNWEQNDKGAVSHIIRSPNLHVRLTFTVPQLETSRAPFLSLSLIYRDIEVFNHKLQVVHILAVLCGSLHLSTYQLSASLPRGTVFRQIYYHSATWWTFAERTFYEGVILTEYWYWRNSRNGRMTL